MTHRKKIWSGSIPLFCLLSFFLGSCQVPKKSVENTAAHQPSVMEMKSIQTAFSGPAISKDLLQATREINLGKIFARDADYYRAITSFKRALVLIPEADADHILEINHHMMTAYYLAGKYEETVRIFEHSPLSSIDSSYPVFNDILTMLYDSYRRLGMVQRLEKVRQLLEVTSPEKLEKLKLSQAISEGDFEAIELFAASNETYAQIDDFFLDYKKKMKSPKRAMIYNALLPGAGYAYVGQKQSALTSFVLNTLFTAAAVHFFEKGDTALGLITTSLELGWYVGGINGAGLAAGDYNRLTYNKLSKRTLVQERLYPFFVLEYVF